MYDEPMHCRHLALASLMLGGCAAIERYDGVLPKPDETVVHAYHSVRSAGATIER